MFLSEPSFATQIHSLKKQDLAEVVLNAGTEFAIKSATETCSPVTGLPEVQTIIVVDGFLYRVEGDLRNEV